MGDGDAGLRELDRVGLALVAQDVALGELVVEAVSKLASVTG
jgi:hypothetical protein